MLDEEDGNAVVGSPRVKQHVSLIKCRGHHESSQNDQADAERQRPGAAASDVSTRANLSINVITAEKSSSLLSLNFAKFI